MADHVCESISDHLAEARAAAQAASGPVPHDATCYLCLTAGSQDQPLLRGCACRGSAGYGHFGCFVESAKADTKGERWTTCPTCGQHFTSELMMGLAQARDGLAADQKSLFSEKKRSAAIGLSIAKQRSGDNAEAVKTGAEILAVQRQIYGNKVMQQSEAIGNVTNLAAALTELGRFDESMELLEEARDGLSELKGCTQESDDSFEIINQNLASMYCHQGQFEKALPMMEEALANARRAANRERSFDSSERLVMALFSLSQLQSSRDDHEKAISIGEEAVQTSIRIFGQAHPLTQTVKSGLEKLRAWGGNPDLSAQEAQEHYFSHRPKATVVGIVSRPELNGQTVRVGEFLSESSRFRVLLSVMEGTKEETETLAMKPENLTFDSGVKVSVFGLTKAPELNGQEGVLKSFDEKVGRYSVSVEGRKKPLGLKPGNVKPL